MEQKRIRLKYFKDRLPKKLKKLGMKVEDLKGCTKAEIDELQSFFELKFPQSYIEFLELMGESAGGIMAGSSIFTDEIRNLGKWSEELLAEDNSNLNLPPNSFVFWMHQGYQFAFFYINQHDNPVVHYYLEGSNFFENTSLLFTEFILMQFPNLSLIHI